MVGQHPGKRWFAYQNSLNDLTYFLRSTTWIPADARHASLLSHHVFTLQLRDWIYASTYDQLKWKPWRLYYDRDVLLSFPTGCGKSLVHQLAPFVLGASMASLHQLSWSSTPQLSHPGSDLDAGGDGCELCYTYLWDNLPPGKWIQWWRYLPCIKVNLS